MNAITTFASAYRQLRPGEKVFVDGYVADLEREANRKGERISAALYRTIPAALVAASHGMLDKPMVCAAITERINEIAAATELTAQRVIKELMAMAFASHGDYMTMGEDGMPYYDLARCTPEQLSAIKTIKYKSNGDGLSRATKSEFELVLHDKPGALRMLMDFMGLSDPNNPHWRAEQARPINVTALPATTTDNGAADIYSAMING